MQKQLEWIRARHLSVPEYLFWGALVLAGIIVLALIGVLVASLVVAIVKTGLVLALPGLFAIVATAIALTIMIGGGIAVERGQNTEWYHAAMLGYVFVIVGGGFALILWAWTPFFDLLGPQFRWLLNAG